MNKNSASDNVILGNEPSSEMLTSQNKKIEWTKTVDANESRPKQVKPKYTDHLSWILGSIVWRGFLMQCWSNRIDIHWTPGNLICLVQEEIIIISGISDYPDYIFYWWSIWNLSLSNTYPVIGHLCNTIMDILNSLCMSVTLTIIIDFNFQWWKLKMSVIYLRFKWQKQKICKI